ncbi:hypothetical protein BJ508DRAFT_338020 [Ascobolus immersus RN42]|uniref:Uncharacterized protein n=1 Tax=Ascobolus immersus RN42 TaxID=1160509 RepID=A0A3N4HQZ3_ASCIM|nr:hypothetical protein BJ508DRAFT_338020 [Ascobolus immersus RN42]
MVPPKGFQKRLTRLRARQQNYVTRWKALNARMSTDFSPILNLLPTKSETAQHHVNRILAIGKPLFASEVTIGNIVAEEAYILGLEGVLLDLRQKIPTLEKVLDTLAVRERTPLFEKGALWGRMEYEASCRADGMNEEMIQVGVASMLEGGVMIDDKPIFGPQPPIELRIQRLSVKQDDFRQRFASFVKDDEPKYRRVIARNDHPERAFGMLWVDLLCTLEHHVSSISLTKQNIELEEKHQQETEARLLRFRITADFLEALFRAGTADAAARKAKYVSAREEGQSAGMIQSILSPKHSLKPLYLSPFEQTAAAHTVLTQCFIKSAKHKSSFSIPGVVLTSSPKYARFLDTAVGQNNWDAPPTYHQPVLSIPRMHSSKHQLQKRIARLKARQSDYTTRWNSLTARITATYNSAIPSVEWRNELEHYELTALTEIGRPNFPAILNKHNIEQEERRLEQLEEQYARQRTALPMFEKGLDNLGNGGDIPREEDTGLYSLVRYQTEMRRRGVGEDAILEGSQHMIEGGLMLDDTPKFGPIPPFSLRKQRLLSKRADFEARREIFIATAALGFDKYHASMSEKDRPVVGNWIAILFSGRRIPVGVGVTMSNIGKEEARLVEAEAWLARIQNSNRYMTALVDQGVADGEEKKAKYLTAFENGGHEEMMHAILLDTEAWRGMKRYGFGSSG